MKAKLLIMLAGIAMLAACKGRSSSMSADSVATDSVKLVKTVDMRIKVKDVQKTGEQITKFIMANGGMVMHHNMQANVVSKQDLQLSNDSIKRLTVYNRAADMVIKVPTYALEPFMDSLNHFSINVDERKMEIEDRTIDYVATKLKAQNRQESVKLRSKIKLTHGGADTILALKDNVVDKQVSNMRTDEATYYSTLTLNLYENNTIRAEIVANDDLGNYNTPLSTRVGLALSRGWFIFSELVVGILNLWMFILTGAVITLIVIYYRRKKKTVKTVA